MWLREALFCALVCAVLPVGVSKLEAAEDAALQQAVLDAINNVGRNEDGTSSPVEPRLADLLNRIQHQLEISPNSMPAEVNRIISELRAMPSASVRINALSESLGKWRLSLPGLSRNDLQQALKERPSPDTEITSQELARRRTVLNERLKGLDEKLTEAGAGRAAWEQFLRWQDTTRFARESNIDPALVEQLDRRWRNAPLAWSHDSMWDVSSAMRDLVVGVRRASSGDSRAKNAERENRALQLWVADTTAADPATLEALAKLRGEFVQLGRSPWLVDRLDRAYSHANCVVRFSSDWLQRRSQTEFERPITVDDNYGGANVQGTGVVTGQLTTGFAPAIGVIRGQIRVKGVSKTRTFGGASGVSVDSSSTTVAEAFKSFAFTPAGLASEPTQGKADTDVVYNSISSGGRSRRQSIAVNEVYARRGSSEQQASEDARRWMSSELDKRFDEAVAPWRTRYRDEVRNALIRRDLFFPTIRCGATNDYVYWRCWLRDWDQFAAPTEPPVPTAEGDCTISLHESFIERACTARLSDVRVTHQYAQQHWGWLLDSFPALSPTTSESETEDDLAVTLADKHSVQVHIANGRITMEMHFSNVETEGDSYPNQAVKVEYDVALDGDALVMRRLGQIAVSLTDADGQPRNSGSRQVAFRRLIERKMEQVLQKELRCSAMSLGQSSSNAKAEELVFADAIATDGWLQLVLRSRPTEVVASSPSRSSP